MSTHTVRLTVASAALCGLVLAAAMTGVLASDGEDAEPPVIVDADADGLARVARKEAFLESLGVPEDLRSLPRKEVSENLYQPPMPTFADMFGDGPEVASAVAIGRVDKVLALRANRIEVQFTVEEVVASRKGAEITVGPIVLVESVVFEGPPATLLYTDNRVPLFPGDRGLLIIRPRYPDGVTETQWIVLMDRGMFALQGDQATALTFGSDGDTAKVIAVAPADVERNAVIDWGLKYKDYSAQLLIDEVTQAASASGWTTLREP